MPARGGDERGFDIFLFLMCQVTISASRNQDLTQLRNFGFFKMSGCLVHVPSRCSRCARRNADLLGLSQNFSVVETSPPMAETLTGRSFDLLFFHVLHYTQGIKYPPIYTSIIAVPKLPVNTELPPAAGTNPTADSHCPATKSTENTPG